jgi:CheY-like chemotaxis protein
MRDSSIDVLLVEDNDDDVVMIEEGFRGTQGLRLFHVCRNGREALEWLDSACDRTDGRLPGLVLLDIKMPFATGFEFLHEIKTDDRLRHIPVVMLTSSNLPADIVEAYRAGACSYVLKPVGYEQLLQVFDRLANYWTRTSRIPT